MEYNNPTCSMMTGNGIRNKVKIAVQTGWIDRMGRNQYRLTYGLAYYPEWQSDD